MLQLKHKPHLGEVSDYMKAIVVILCHDIEEEGVSVIVEGLVVQEQLCQEAQVLGIQLGGGGGGG